MKKRSLPILLKTRHFRQSKARCGPASLKIVAHYFGLEVDEALLARACGTSSLSGTTGENLAAAARKLGLGAKIVDNATWSMIRRWLYSSVPVIVDWMSIGERGTARVATGHYSVVCGLSADEIILEDPAIGRKRRLPRTLFESLWYDFKYLGPRKPTDLVMRRMLVVAPPHKLQGGRGSRTAPP